MFHWIKCCQSAGEYATYVTQQMTPQMDNNGSESDPAPLESNEDTELDDTQPENIQDSESNLTAIDTAPLSKKQLY